MALFMKKSCDSIIDSLSNLSQKKSQVRGILTCSCGCNHFFLFKRKKTAEESLEELIASNRLKNDYWPFGFEIARDKNGKIVVRSSFLGFHWKERPYEEYLPSVRSFQYVSAKCERCERKIVLYDERLQDIDGGALRLKYGELGKVVWSKTSSVVECVFDYDEGDIQSIEEPGRIRIYSITNGKKSLFFDWET